jgi:putative transposase
MNSQRRLPHIYPDHCWLFVTWHLHGSLPQGRYPPPAKASAGEAFVWIDRYLDLARDGPVFLRQDAIAQLVVDSLFRGVELGHYKLGSFAVMANHVHVLLLPEISPGRLLKSLKAHTAREANRLLGRTGEPFWQRESYDHWVRDAAEYSRISAYIEANPLKAGLVKQAEDYRWSSGNQKWRERLGGQAFTKCERGTQSACATELPKSLMS